MIFFFCNSCNFPPLNLNFSSSSLQMIMFSLFFSSFPYKILCTRSGDIFLLNFLLKPTVGDEKLRFSLCFFVLRGDEIIIWNLFEFCEWLLVDFDPKKHFLTFFYRSEFCFSRKCIKICVVLRGFSCLLGGSLRG